MTQAQIDALLKSYFISNDDLERRSALHEFSHSLSAIVIDDFAQNYILNNPELSIYLAHTDIHRFIKNIKEFVAFTLTAPVDEDYVQKILSVGSVHFSIKLEPANVSYGFWAINEVLNKLSNVNELVKEHRTLISKIFRFVEHVMNKGYYQQKEKSNKASLETSKSFSAQNELYLAFQLHKRNMQKIELALESTQNISILEEIDENSDSCAFGKVLQTLIVDKKFENIFELDIHQVKHIHDSWHEEFVKFKQAVLDNNSKDIQLYKNNISNLTDNLKKILDDTLQNSLKDGQIALNSGIKAMRNMTDLFHKRELHHDYKNMFKETLKDTFHDFNWAIDDICFNFENETNLNCTIKKTIRHDAKNIFIGINVKPEQNNDYIIEMISMLLEVLDLHFSIKEREASLISFADKAEAANKSKDMFLANMSHELRTPLNAITGFSQIIMMKKDTPEAIKNYVEKINIAGNNLLDLVNTILDFAKLEAGKMQFSPRLSNISNVISEVTTLISPLALKKEITLKMPKIISLNLYIDDKLFKQVLINLLTNAVKFTPEGGNVSLSIVYDASKHMYEFEVKDNGIGLSKDSISKLFQAFSQVDNSYQKLQQGTGLGLMISKKIIEDLHKGKIWVESEENKGSSFFLSMPTPMIESHTYSINEAPKDARVALVVEDTPSYQKILAEHLKSEINLTFTDTVNKAKDLLTKNSYDFLILDFFLTDGISSEILEFMEEEHIEIPTIVISAEEEIHISSSLSGSTNLEGIMNKNNIDNICASIRGEAFDK